MAVRVTSTEVEEIIENDESITLTPFIAAANILVTKFCTDLTEDYTTAELLDIERWLSAHFFTVRAPRRTSEKVGSVGERFQNERSVDLGFDTSHYGQMAMRLDYHGGLAKLNEQIKKGIAKRLVFTWTGTEKPTADD